MAATVIKPTPPVFKGFGATEQIRSGVKIAHGPTLDTTTAMSTSGTTVELFEVYPGITILDLQMVNTTLWSGTGNSFLVGDSDNTDRFHDTTTWLSTNAGRQSSYLADGLGFSYASSDPRKIVATLVISSGTALASGRTVPVLIYTDDLISG